MRCAVIGGGAWGTALADLLARNGHDGHAVGARARRRRRRSTRGTRTRASSPAFTLSPTRARDGRSRRGARRRRARRLRDAVARPARDRARGRGRTRARGVMLGVASKGIERGDARAHDATSSPRRCPGIPSSRSRGRASRPRSPRGSRRRSSPRRRRRGAARLVQDALSTPTFRVYTHDDVVGVELGGALKNVMAVATGIVEGLGLGFNSRAALITRGPRRDDAAGRRARRPPVDLRRARRAGRPRAHVHRRAEPQSRGRRRRSGQGATLEEALAGKQTVAEGVRPRRRARWRSRRARASRCRSSTSCIAFCSTAIPRGAPSPS